MSKGKMIKGKKGEHRVHKRFPSNSSTHSRHGFEASSTIFGTPVQLKYGYEHKSSRGGEGRADHIKNLDGTEKGMSEVTLKFHSGNKFPHGQYFKSKGLQLRENFSTTLTSPSRKQEWAVINQVGTYNQWFKSGGTGASDFQTYAIRPYDLNPYNKNTGSVTIGQFSPSFTKMLLKSQEYHATFKSFSNNQMYIDVYVCHAMRDITKVPNASTPGNFNDTNALDVLNNLSPLSGMNFNFADISTGTLGADYAEVIGSTPQMFKGWRNFYKVAYKHSILLDSGAEETVKMHFTLNQVGDYAKMLAKNMTGGSSAGGTGADVTALLTSNATLEFQTRRGGFEVLVCLRGGLQLESGTFPLVTNRTIVGPAEVGIWSSRSTHYELLKSTYNGQPGVTLVESNINTVSNPTEKYTNVLDNPAAVPGTS